MSDIHVDVRLYRWDERDGPFPDRLPREMAAEVLSFENLANATAAFDDIRERLNRVQALGIHLRADRVKPGFARKRTSEEMALRKQKKAALDNETAIPLKKASVKRKTGGH